MLSILDKYILKRYIGTFALLLLLFIPIGITVNLAEKIDKILQCTCLLQKFNSLVESTVHGLS